MAARTCLKHGFDRVLALAVLALGWPVYLAIAAAVVIEDVLSGELPMSPFHSEARLSGGRTIRVVKFRIFKPSALRRRADERGGDAGYVKALEHKAGQVSRVGRLLRDFYFDELPQVANILLGQMSFVGPRPIPLEGDPVRTRMFGSVPMRGGLTGIHQLGKGSKRSQHEMDQEYYEHWSTLGAWRLLVYDLGILYRTFFKVSKGEGL